MSNSCDLRLQGHLTIILPTLNESKNISVLIPEILHIFDGIELEILVVDDQSTDGTKEIVDSIARIDSRVKLIQRSVPNGLTGAIAEGIVRSHSRFVGWLDSDQSMPPEILFNLFAQSVDLDTAVVGSRFITGGGYKGQNLEQLRLFSSCRNLKNSNDSFIAVILSRLLNHYLRWTIRGTVRDLTSGFIVLPRKYLLNLGLSGYYGDYFPILISDLIRNGVKVVEYPYFNLPRRFGESKTGSNLFQLIRTGIPYLKAPLIAQFKSRRFKL
jgi:dolichol-phosphate mannosyltransferase